MKIWKKMIKIKIWLKLTKKQEKFKLIKKQNNDNPDTIENIPMLKIFMLRKQLSKINWKKGFNKVIMNLVMVLGL